MKYVVLLCDGMSDEPLEALEGKTPLCVAKTSHMDTLARVSEIGMVHTIPKGMKAEPEIASLSILGYNPSSIEGILGENNEEPFDDFYTHTGKKGAVITADENVRIIAEKIGLEKIFADGASGDINTNFTGKKDAAVKAFFENDMDFVLLHVKAPDDASVNKSLNQKITAIENIDAYIVGPLVEELQGRDTEFRLLILPDYPTPVRLGTHSSEAVPYLLFDSTLEEDGNPVYSEKTAKEKDNFYDEGYELLNHFLELD